MAKYPKIFGFALLVVSWGIGFVGIVSAANVTSTADVVLSLSNPAVEFTLLSGSKVDSLVVNTGSVTLTVPAGGNFTLTSASRGLNISGGTAGGSTDNLTCNNGTARLEFNANVVQEITITPTASQCSPGPSSAGGGGGSGLVVTAAAVTSTVVAAEPVVSGPAPASIPSLPEKPSLSDVQKVLEAVVKQVAYIQANLTAPNAKELLGNVVRRVAELQSALRAQGRILPTAGSYSANLFLGAKGDEVRALQSFLKSQGLEIYPEGLVTGYFGSLTKAAVQRFQLKYGIVSGSNDPGYGVVGPKTRAKIKELLGL